MVGKTLIPVAIIAAVMVIAPSPAQAYVSQASGPPGQSSDAQLTYVEATISQKSDPRVRRAQTGKITIVVRGDRLGKKQTSVLLEGVKGKARGTTKRVRVKKSRTVKRLSIGRYRVLGKTATTSAGTATAKPKTVRVSVSRTRKVVLRYVPVVTGGAQSPAPVAEEEPNSTPDELEVLRLTNMARSTATNCGGETYSPAPPLNWNNDVAAVARAHSADMAINSYFSHTDLTGGDMGDRLASAGVAYGWAGENIAAGYPTAAEVVQGWLDSPGHCVNIMRSAFTEMGAGYAVASGGADKYGDRWTQVFTGPTR